MYQYFFKRCFDIVLSLLALICISPILIVFSILLYFANNGAGVFFCQPRPGYKGKIFKVIKFKTMNDNKGPDGNLLPDTQRITRIGKFVRNSSIDELIDIEKIYSKSINCIEDFSKMSFVELMNKYN